MTKNIFAFVAVFVGLSAQADVGRKIDSFEIIRSGGGAMTVTVTEDASGAVTGAVTCRAVTIVRPPSDANPSTETTTSNMNFAIKGNTALEANAILADQALLAATVMLEPVAPSGTFVSMKLSYTAMMPSGLEVKKETVIQKPLVLLNGVASNVLVEIETQARAVATKFCK